MKSYILLIIAGMLCLGILFPFTSSAQIQESYHGSGTTDSPWKGYKKEFGSSLVGYTIAGYSTVVIGVGATFATLAFLQDSPGLSRAMLLTAITSAAITPGIAGYFMHRYGKEYNPAGKLGIAILGSYLGTAITYGSIRLLFPNSFLEGFGPLFIGTPVSWIIPALVGVLTYNIFPDKREKEIGSGLINKTKSGLSSGLPAISLSQLPAYPNKICTQICLISISL